MNKQNGFDTRVTELPHKTLNLSDCIEIPDSFDCEIRNSLVWELTIKDLLDLAVANGFINPETATGKTFLSITATRLVAADKTKDHEQVSLELDPTDPIPMKTVEEVRTLFANTWGFSAVTESDGPSIKEAKCKFPCSGNCQCSDGATKLPENEIDSYKREYTNVRVADDTRPSSMKIEDETNPTPN